MPKDKNLEGKEVSGHISRRDFLRDAGLVVGAPTLGTISASAAAAETAEIALPAAAAASPIATLDTAMSQHIERALAATRGRIEGRYGAAQLLGINPHTLRARMRKLQIDWRRFRTPGAG